MLLLLATLRVLNDVQRSICPHNVLLSWLTPHHLASAYGQVDIVGN